MTSRDIPKDVLGPKPRSPKEYAEQQDRIEKWLIKQATERALKMIEEEGKK